MYGYLLELAELLSHEKHRGILYWCIRFRRHVVEIKHQFKNLFYSPVPKYITYCVLNPMINVLDSHRKTSLLLFLDKDMLKTSLSLKK